MKKLIILFLIYFFGAKSIFQDNIIASAVTYTKPNGRLGDQLFCYCKAKWISYKYNILLYYKPFKYSDKLCLSFIEESYKDLVKERYLKLEKLSVKTFFGEVNPENFIYISQDFSEENTLYIIDQYFFPEIWKNLVFDMSNVIQPYNLQYSRDYIIKGKNKYEFRHDEMIVAFKQDLGFIEELRKVIKPIHPLKEIEKPSKTISVAVHVRIGGGFDGPHVSPFFYKSDPQLNNYIDFISGKNNSLYFEIQRNARNNLARRMPITLDLNKREFESDILRPLKHVPMQFYVDQIKGLSAMLKNTPLFVYIFTDQQNPCDIRQMFEKLIDNKNIKFSCREEENSYSCNVLEDLFAMSKFDCLIRPYSSLSQTAQLIGQHKIVISPYHGIWYKDKLIIDEVLITIQDESFVRKFVSDVRKCDE